MDPATHVNIGNKNESSANSNNTTANNTSSGGNFTAITTTTNINGDNNHITIPAQQPDEKKRKILEWISPLDLPDRHQYVRGRRFECVGNWLLQTRKFSDWAYGSANSTLFCYGDPGVGKTYISSLVIDTLHREAGERNFRVFYVYCDYLTHKEQSAIDLIAGLLKKVVAGLDGIPEEVSQWFEKSKNHGGDRIRPLLPEVINMLDTVLESFGRTFICIDALDEFPLEQRADLLSNLAELAQRRSETRLFLTGRPLIQDEMEYLDEGAQIISVKLSEDDIKKYVIQRLKQDPNRREMNSQLRKDIVEILPQKVSGIFLLVYLKMNAILEAVTIYDRRERLLAMENSPELWGEYSKTLDRIVQQGPVRSQLALKVLMWLCYSKRPLHVDELRHAVAVEKGPTRSNPEKASSPQTLSDCCLGLVTVDNEGSAIHLIHSTLKDFLRKCPERIQGTNLTIAETCLTYLNFEDIKSLPLSFCTAPENTPFLQYASCFWGEHAREETTDHTKALAKKLLGLYNKHISAKLLLLEKSWPWGYDPKGLPDGFSGLHCAAFFGLQETAIAFLDTEVPNSGRKDITGSTPLTWAARNGHKELVQLFLGRKDIFDPEAEDNGGCTPFSWAARNGHEDVVKLFLEEGAISLETKDSFGRTPLSWACAGGHRDVVELLLETGRADPKSADSDGCTPVSRAAEEGNDGVVDFYLRYRGFNPNLPDHDGRTLLSRAAENGRWSVVKLLLGQAGIEFDTEDKYGMTPLSRAANKGNEEVVKLFMEKGETKSDLAAKDGSTSLWWAAGSGHAGVVKILLGWKGVDPNFVGKYRQTPLMRAAMHGREEVVKLLLGPEHANHSLADDSNRTPLSWAAGNGHDKVVGLLLKGENIDTELADKDGQTPLSWAARTGKGGSAQLLLKEGNAYPLSRDANGRTPVSWAAGEGHGRLVNLLLSQPDVNPNSADNIGRTPLSWAAGNGWEAVTNLLLSQSNIEPNTVDSAGRTPLSWAAENGWGAVTNLLLRQSNIKPDMTDGNGRTPLSWAAQNGYDEVVELLIRRQDVNLDSMDCDGQTPLSWAARNGHKGVVQLLIKRVKDPYLAASDGRTPLSWARENEHGDVVRLLEWREPASTPFPLGPIPEPQPLTLIKLIQRLLQYVMFS